VPAARSSHEAGKLGCERTPGDKIWAPQRSDGNCDDGVQSADLASVVRYLVAEFQQLAMDPRCAPQEILPSHPDDQLADLARNALPASTPMKTPARTFVAATIPAGANGNARADPRLRWSVWAVGVRHGDFAQGRPHKGDRWRLRSLRERVRRRGVRSDGGARRLAECRSPCRCLAAGPGEYPGNPCRATNGSASRNSNRRTRTGRGADGVR
jgi:hypothetical protein